MSCLVPDSCRACALYNDKAGFCARLSQGELVELNAQSHSETIRRGSRICGQVLERWPILAVERGALGLQQVFAGGRRTIAGLFMRGDILDLRNATGRLPGELVALSETRICRLSPARFERILQTNEAARVLVWDNLRAQAFRAIAHGSDLAGKNAREKVAAFIVQCAGRAAPAAGRHDEDLVEIPMRRRDLGEYLGMQPETVSRTFRDLEKSRLIRACSLTSLRILDLPALRRVAAGEASGAA